MLAALKKFAVRKKADSFRKPYRSCAQNDIPAFVNENKAVGVVRVSLWNAKMRKCRMGDGEKFKEL